MLTALMTHHQVMPVFLDFLFLFGYQEYPQDFYFSGFRSETRLTEQERSLCLPLLGRSGYTAQMCYNLKSPEESPIHSQWPWSIRTAAIYHSWDIETGRTAWISVKGNDLLQKRIRSESCNPSSHPPAGLPQRTASLDASLSAHLLFCDWAVENWRWYITFLEEEVQERTRGTLTIKVDRTSRPSANCPPWSPTRRWTRRTDTMDTRNDLVKRPLSRALTRVSQKLSFHESDGGKNAQTAVLPVTLPLTPPEPTTPPFGSNEDSQDMQHDQIVSLQFSNLQGIHGLEEKANEACLVLKSNSDICRAIRSWYRETIHNADLAALLGAEHEAHEKLLPRFEKRMINFEEELGMQISRVENLIRLISDRKSLVG